MEALPSLVFSTHTLTVSYRVVVYTLRLLITIAPKDISSLISGLILTIIGRNDPIHCISRSKRLKINFSDAIKIFLKKSIKLEP